MAFKCYSCGEELTVSGVIGRSEECPSCRADVRVCLNCDFYDKAAYNECKEPNAERVVEKNRRNFCDFFRPNSSNNPNAPKTKSKEELLKELDNLFKK